MDLKHLFKEDIVSIKKINKGFSLDEKIIVNDKYLVRIIGLERYERFKEVFRVQKDFEKIGLCQKAISLSKDKYHGYYLTEYLEGEDGLEVIDTYSKDKQYELGMIAAKEIVKFHKAYPLLGFDMKKHLNDYLNTKIELTIKNNVSELLPEIDNIIELVRNNIHYLYGLDGVQTHADYHLFNMIFYKGEYQGVIDFERVRPGPFLNDFRNNTPHNSQVSPYFASGYIDGYLDEIPIQNFFLLYNIYDLMLAIATIPWVQKFDSDNVNKSIQMIQSIYEQRDNLSSSPKWYLGKYH
jgi:aminoglycoside phosphotransferase (APT) family kinase protein